MAVTTGVGCPPVYVEFGDKEHPIEPVHRTDPEDAEVGAATLLRVDVTEDELVAEPLGGGPISDSALASFAHVVCAERCAACEAAVDSDFLESH